ncbi:APC family permease [Nocardia beijingensis]|uniref:APC family permease n=1 Tax=Nocardia beijingensis TaxID=95162 RepID=UPI0018940751|nr:APC family permease [Nocardia beijingensis]MBF6468680.1 APC family permease [Nocardia beijingensis]
MSTPHFGIGQVRDDSKGFDKYTQVRFRSGVDRYEHGVQGEPQPILRSKQVPEKQHADTSRQRVRSLRLWEVMALSLASVGPMMALSGNAQGTAGYVGAAIPVAMACAAGGVLLIALGFAILSRHTAHMGSVYGLVGKAIGPRSGMFSGIAILGAYVALATCCGGIFAATFNSLLQQILGADAFQLPWIVPALACVVVAATLAFAGTSTVARVLLISELLGVGLALVLAITVFARGGAPSTGIDLSSTLDLEGVPHSALLAAGVMGFLAWAGFEAGAALGEETADPKRNIPLALVGVVIIVGLLYTFVMTALVCGFGTDTSGLDALESSGSTLGDLGTRYLGPGFSIAIVITVCISAFAGNLAVASAAGRIICALARDGIGPRALAKSHAKLGTPTNAVVTVLVLNAALNTLGWATGFTNMGTGNPAIDAYIYFASIGSVALLVSYLTVQVAGIRQSFTEFRTGPAVCMFALLTLGGVGVVLVLLANLRAQESILTGPATWGLLWCGAGLAVALFSSQVTARRIQNSLQSDTESDAGEATAAEARVLSKDQ